MLNSYKKLWSFAVCPLMRAYQPKPTNNLLTQELRGGHDRQRVNIIGSIDLVNVSVLLNTAAKEQYFWAFWELHQKKPQPFLWKLKLRGDRSLKDYECQFIADSLDVGERSGNKYSVSFSVTARITSSEYDPATYVAIYNNTDGDPNRYFNLLEKLVNEALPDSFNGPN